MWLQLNAQVDAIHFTTATAQLERAAAQFASDCSSICHMLQLNLQAAAAQIVKCCNSICKWLQLNL